MGRVVVRILHREPPVDAGPLVRGVAAARLGIANRACAAFRVAGATEVAIVSGPPDSTSFGTRLRGLVQREEPDGVVVAGSGALALARPRDLVAFLGAAAAPGREALANNRYSADVIGVAGARALAGVPDLPSDNVLPRWLEEHAGYRVRDLRHRWRLQVDVDGPLDAVLVGAVSDSAETAQVRRRRAAIAALAADPRAELVVAGRTSPRMLAVVERAAAARVRALVEERGLRAGGGANARPPASIVGTVLDRDGPETLGALLARLGDAALVDTRVLLAHRLGADEAAWPPPEDRFAADLLLPDEIGDPWLRALTVAARDAPIPILLGGHTLVGPGLPLAVRRITRP